MAVIGYVVRVGDLRNRVTLQTRVTLQDASGQPIESWATAFSGWADIASLTGRELMAAQAVQSTVSHQVTMRYRSEFSNPKAVAGMRILYNTRVFNIHACLDQDTRRRAVILLAEEGLNNG